jgi:hypothetical protein
MDKVEPGTCELFDEIVAALNDSGIDKLIFNKRVFADRQQIRGLRFTKDVEFIGANFKEGLSLYLCEFEKGLLIDDVSFGGRSADFGDCRFSDYAVFRPKYASMLSLRSGVFTKGFEIAPPRDPGLDIDLAPMEIDLRFARISGEASISVLDFRQYDYQGRTRPVRSRRMTLLWIKTRGS